MAEEKLFLNTLTFEYPNEPVKFYFSEKDDVARKSIPLKSPVLIPKEVKQAQKYIDLFAGCGGLTLYTTFDIPTDGFDAIDIDFNEPENENLIKRYYNRRLEKYFKQFDEVITTSSGITRDLQVWIRTNEPPTKVSFNGHSYNLYSMDRFTLKVRFDTYNNNPYLLVANDRPSQIMGVPMKRLFDDNPDDPFSGVIGITPSMINKVMTKEEKKNKDGKIYFIRKIEKLAYLQEKNLFCAAEHTFPIIGGELKKVFGMERNETNDHTSKYIKYLDKITRFKNKYLQPEKIGHIFQNIATDFTLVDSLQIGQTNSSKRMLRFKNGVTNVRQRQGIEVGPAKSCPHKDVRIFGVFHTDDKEMARNLLTWMRKGNYHTGIDDDNRALSHYIGTTVTFAPVFVEFTDRHNPVPEIEAKLREEQFRNLSNDAKYVGLYITPIRKYGSTPEEKECYYKIKELFLSRGIVTQCVELDKMKKSINRDNEPTTRFRNFTYTLQNMAVAICAKTGGAPWLLDEVEKKELIIGIGAFKSENEQYIGAAFSFDNTGIFNDYHYFQKSEIDELVGSIHHEILTYSSVNNKPERIIIHYYKKMSYSREFQKIEDMLSSLNLDIPVYIVTINKTESEDIVVFDRCSTFEDKRNGTTQSLMPFSGRWVNLGRNKDGYRFLLCNNTRYEQEPFSKMDGFPFPIKLNIACPNRDNEVDTRTINQLIDQVYQFSRIYWKSVKQQGLPVTIKYPEMIAEIMPHFEDHTIYTDNNCLWFL